MISWSATLRPVRPSRAAANDLRGDKIVLPQSALEQLLASSTGTNGWKSTFIFPASEPSNPYAAAHAQQERPQELPHPLMFQLANPATGKTVYAGIREFSASEGEVALSPHIREALGIQELDIQEGPQEDDRISDSRSDKGDENTDEGLRITVKATQLPAGTYVRLRPLEAGYNPDDWKPLLERQLRGNFTTLTKGSTISIQGTKGEEFRLLADKFLPEGDGICVIDTDLETDIEPLNEDQARETLRQIAAKGQRRPETAATSSVGGAMDIWKEVEGRVLEGDYVDYELPSWDRSRAIVIELILHDGREVDLFVSPKTNRQRAIPRDIEHTFGDFSSPKDGVKRILIEPTSSELEGAESLMVSVHGFSGLEGGLTATKPCRYTLRARAADIPGSSAAPIEIGNPEPSADEEQCKNCLQIIPTRTMMLHENFCLRNNIICPQCKNVFQKRSQEWEDHWHCTTHPDAYGSGRQNKAKHDFVQHTQHMCQSCGPSTSFTFPSLPELARHRTTVCPSKLILCQFCHLEVPQEGDPLDPSSEAETAITGLTAHERADGARTTDCHLCGAIIRLRDMAAHSANHELDKAARAAPEICRDQLCGRTLHGIGPRGQVNGGTRMGQGPGNDLGLCSLCFAPLYVNMYDPEGKALRRRIERRYLAQLMAGCGRKWCANEWCKTGRANQGLEQWGGTAAAALPLVKPLLGELADHEKPMRFCVDEVSQRRKKTAAMMAAEGAWELEWCVAALEAEGGNLGKARGWLGDWAPTKVAGR
ncbi:hypothetical protein CHGG_08754 [Chaetomium globosum CBS 148.51]|uniref:Uncharacterized protein n=1 Tax=Chaetomium globosum (strain ATCC 6205 / CBS 148.51 / DSM 1962 / NBRC 6347 / NRRL 1970) TaxID=306901 RepID=Q2GTF0_CHAGB|nr:uncharacterized protein CHGG_08754 [Chaetomium globosum CBS 148.51]EAQ84740.1 hypothetical protein CHGG_08754 [Chaetomium globosum CBS 148.51]